MKTSPTHQCREEGSYLVATVLFTAIMTFSLAGYLSLASSQNRSTYRSLAWNSIVPVMEAGVEEALAHLNKNGVTNIAADGWSSSVTNQYSKTTAIGDSSYTATIVVANPSRPEILAVGTVPAPLASAGLGPLLAAAGVNTPQASITRRVRVTTRNNALFVKGMVAVNNIGWNGNIMSDSFDSTDPLYSSQRRYDMAKRKDNGSVASNDGSVSMGGGTIYGSVSTGPTGSASGGKVGDAAWMADSTKSGIQPGHYANDMNVQFPPVNAPSTAGSFTPSGGTGSYTNSTFTTSVIISDVYPSPVPASGVTTNSVSTVTSFTFPSVYFGGVITNSVVVISPNYPNPLPAGAIVTNTSFVVSSTIPNPVPAGGYVTLTTNTTSSGYPAFGTFTGTVTTNTSAMSNQKNAPASGTYVPGSLVTLPNGRYTYLAITGYNYQLITGYRYATTTYSYHTVSYTYVAAINYTYSGYTTNLVVTTASFSYILGSGTYVLDSLSLSGQSQMLVTGNAILYVKGALSMAGQSQIILSQGASLKLYVGGDASLKGNGVMNYSLDALQFSLYGLPTCTSIDLGGNASFTGTMYAPNAAFKAGGGGNNQYDCVGAVIVKSVSMNGHFTFHYDEALGKNGPSSGFVVTSWNEE
ncbi:MAG: hypothetical protein H7X97_12895 [Opitutaceae bacterium]|nr:hypothetical protein [Verrucomicrobiales bacterium]